MQYDYTILQILQKAQHRHDGKVHTCIRIAIRDKTKYKQELHKVNISTVPIVKITRCSDEPWNEVTCYVLRGWGIFIRWGFFHFRKK